MLDIDRRTDGKRRVYGLKYDGKLLSLLLWVTQFGLSVLFPLCFFLLLAVWLQNRFGLGMWIVALLGIVGLLTSLRTARACIRALRKDADAAGVQKQPPTAFGDHDEKG